MNAWNKNEKLCSSPEKTTRINLSDVEKKEAYYAAKKINHSGEQEVLSSSLLSFAEAGEVNEKQIAPTQSWRYTR